jgi:DNA-binding transcriptional regulator YiaG
MSARCLDICQDMLEDEGEVFVMVARAEVTSALHVRSMRDALGLSRERMARLLDVSAKTIERWEARNEPPVNRTARQRLAQIQEIVELGLIVYTPKGFHHFMTLPMPAFDGRTALQLIEQGDAERVFGELAADYEGIGF